MEMKGKGAGAQGYPPRGLEQRPNSMESARPTKTRNSRKTDVHYRFLLTAHFLTRFPESSTQPFWCFSRAITTSLFTDSSYRQLRIPLHCNVGSPSHFDRCPVSCSMCLRRAASAALLLGTFRFFGRSPRPFQTETSDGGSVLTSYGVRDGAEDVNKNSTLHRAWHTINDETCPIQLLKAGVRTEKRIGSEKGPGRKGARVRRDKPLSRSTPSWAAST